MEAAPAYRTSSQTAVQAMREARYRFSTWGENIAWGGGKLGTPASIVRNWMKSRGHRANILNGAFKESGIGIAVGDPDSTVSGFPAATYTQVFATPR
ncbi:MAG: CAP domain-containing protein [Solirubrobacteraceae bacterium]